VSLRPAEDGVELHSLRIRPTFSLGRPWKLRYCADNWSISAREALCRLGPLSARITWEYDEHGVVVLDVAWRNDSGRTLVDVAIGLVLDPGVPDDARVTVPHLIYNDNPSADPARVIPRLGRGIVCEEDRLPIPGVNLEWDTGDYLSVLTRPEPRRSPGGAVRYGSLGVLPGPSVAVLSGVLMFDGAADVRYVSKAETAPTEDGYLVLGPGEIVRRRCLLDQGRTERRGMGFRQLVRLARREFEGSGARPLSLDGIIRYKTAALDSRWYASDGVGGYTKFSVAEGNGPDKPPHFLYGWTGQCLKLAWCDARIGFEAGDRWRVDRCRSATDFYLRCGGTVTPGLLLGTYLIEDGVWDTFQREGLPMISSRAHGETMADLADIILLFQEYGEAVPRAWVDALDAAVGFFRKGLLVDGTFPVGWRPDGTPVQPEMPGAAGIPCVLATLKAYRVTGDPTYLADARMWAARYHDIHARTFDRPFAHATLDAACEDKEAGLFYFLMAYELFSLTHDQMYADWAEVAADWLLTFVYVWSPSYDAGSPLDRAGFSAVGWAGVSVQNHHLDAFFPTYELKAFARDAGRPEYARAADTILLAMGQTICTTPGEWGFQVVGEQGEAVFQTHWQRRGTANTWNPSWVIAEVLSNALRIRSDFDRPGADGPGADGFDADG
jgi:hypothetical protein